MLVFESLYDIFLDSILDMQELTEDERASLIASVSGVSFHLMNQSQKDSFKIGVQKYANRFFNSRLRQIYERG